MTCKFREQDVCRAGCHISIVTETSEPLRLYEVKMVESIVDETECYICISCGSPTD
jgi:hypothetical protein